MRVPDFFVRHISEPLWDLYENSVRLKTLKQMQQSQWSSPEDIQAQQQQDLRRMCQHAVKTSPFYRERFLSAGVDADKINGIEDLSKLPLLTKADIRKSTTEILSDTYRRQDLVPAKTGGSTGVALEVFCDRRGVEMRNGAALRADIWSGWQLGQSMAAVWGNPPTPRTLKNKLRATWKDRIIFLDTMKINDEAVDIFLRQWQKAKPGLLFGHAHSIYIFAEALLARGLTIAPRGIVATSMMLVDSERKVIEEACGTRVTNRYGCEEVSLISCECEVHQGLHLNAEHVIVEFLDEAGRPCPAGQNGRIVVTELVNFAMPMIRYEVGDWGVPSERQCSCGRGLPLMESITGRTADFLLAQDGSRVAGISIIENTLTHFQGIRQLQIVQDKPLSLTVNLVPSAQYDDNVTAQLLTALRGMLGSDFSIAVELVDAIAQETNGKYRFTICKI